MALRPLITVEANISQMTCLPICVLSQSTAFENFSNARIVCLQDKGAAHKNSSGVSALGGESGWIFASSEIL
jgi:hypothetical protein